MGQPTKRLLVCCDGTWNAADTQTANTNVAIMARAIHGSKETDIPQIVLYLRGVGTSGLQLENWIDGAIGFGIDSNILSAYMFIAQNYLPDDEIFIFGFSRGSFTARSLSGFISACGILKRQKLGDLPKAWAYYRSPGLHSPALFMENCGTECHLTPEIKFLGVWDTVGALGIPGQLLSAVNERRFAFHNTDPSALVKHGCHALAIDEHRDAFVPTFWTGEPLPGTMIEQVWFAGAHADVGGGYVTRKLADIPLVWMARKAEQDGLILDWTCLPDPEALDPLAPTHDSRKGLFEFDRLRPTWREVAGRSFPVSFYERLYAPAGPDGQPLTPINEKIHSSVVKRFGKMAQVCTSDENGDCSYEDYVPRNLAAFIENDEFGSAELIDDR